MSPATVQTLQVGDLVRFGSVLRKVRAVTPRKKPGHRYRSNVVPLRVWCVTFAILRRSWTNRPYTVYTHYDLTAKHIRLFKRGVRLRTTKTERLVQQEIESRSNERFITADRMVGLVV